MQYDHNTMGESSAMARVRQAREQIMLARTTASEQEAKRVREQSITAIKTTSMIKKFDTLQ